MFSFELFLLALRANIDPRLWHDRRTAVALSSHSRDTIVALLWNDNCLRGNYNYLSDIGLDDGEKTIWRGGRSTQSAAEDAEKYRDADDDAKTTFRPCNTGA